MSRGDDTNTIFCHLPISSSYSRCAARIARERLRPDLCQRLVLDGDILPDKVRCFSVEKALSYVSIAITVVSSSPTPPCRTSRVTMAGPTCSSSSANGSSVSCPQSSSCCCWCSCFRCGRTPAHCTTRVSRRLSSRANGSIGVTLCSPRTCTATKRR